MRCAIGYYLHNFKKVTKYSWRNVTFSKVAGFSPICTIWCYLCNLKNVKNIHEEVLFLIKLEALLSLQGTPSLQANSIINAFSRNFQSFPYSCFNLISYAADTLHLWKTRLKIILKSKSNYECHMHENRQGDTQM